MSNALLDLEEVRAGDTLSGERVDVTAMITDLAERYDARATAQGRHIRTTPDVVQLQGNRHWLDVALRNLVSNALRYGQGTITISTAQNDGRVQLSVSDEGTGFPLEFTDKAFDRFTRAESSRSTHGTGLGLSLVQAVAEAHGGTATITGSRVTLDLPTAHPSI
jgi:signal transduction histidine kinase